MKCEEYRQAIAADPGFDGGSEHLGECAACREYRAEMQALDARISRALTIDVPELTMPELPEIEEDKVVPLRRRRPAAPAWFAMAATVAIAAILGVRMMSSSVEFETLEDEVLAHLDHEPAALRVTNVPVNDERLHTVVPASIADLDHSAGLITYAQSCPIRGKIVPHLVMQGKQGPVTILLMPEEKITEAVQLSGEHVNGVILPVGDGSIAIIGGREERLDNIQEELLKSVTWTT